MPDVDFLAPARLWLLVLPVAVAVWYVVQQVRRRGYVLRFSDVSLFDDVAPDRPGWRRHLPAAVACTALATMVLAFARPALAELKAVHDGVVVLAVDTSLSMEATDVSPSRIEAARDAAEAFLDEMPDGVRVGLVTFDSSARVRVAPVADVEAVRAALAGIDLNEGTAIGDAIDTSVAAVIGASPAATAALRDGDARAGSEDRNDAGPEPGVAIVLLSDGETTVGRPDSVGASTAADAGIPVHTVAFGTDSGTITLPTGDVVPVPVNREALAEVARTTGAETFSAETASELTSVYEDLGKRLTRTDEPREITDRFAGVAFALGLVGAAGSLRWFGRLP